MGKRSITIREYDYLCIEKPYIPINDRLIGISEKDFNELENMVLSNNLTDIDVFFTLGTRRGVGKVLQAKNYVGVVQTKGGTSVEILPKICLPFDDESCDETRNLFLKMLRSLRNPLFKKLNFSNLNIDNMRLIEVFIIMFLEEVSSLIKRRMKSGYVTNEDNASVLKGKLLFNQHIKYNIVHKERFYIQYDEYKADIPENRLIKATLQKLKGIAKSQVSQQRIKQYLFALDEVPVSVNYPQDFQLCSRGRLMEDYKLLLEWCEVFLYNESFTNYQGDTIAYALLFPMEKIFEDYMGKAIRRSSLFSDFDVTLQEKTYWLFDNPNVFKLNPDIVLRKNDFTIVMDTKWKMINANIKNLGVSESDMYQIYTYCKRYSAKKAVLLYPKSLDATGLQSGSVFSNGDVDVHIFFVDLWDIDSSLDNLAEIIIEINELLLN